jgi:hypothetical protein
MYVAVVLARVKSRRESRTPVVKSSDSVEPSPRLFNMNNRSVCERAFGRWNRPRRLRIAGSDQMKA